VPCSPPHVPPASRGPLHRHDLSRPRRKARGAYRLVNVTMVPCASRPYAPYEALTAACAGGGTLCTQSYGCARHRFSGGGADTAIEEVGEEQWVQESLHKRPGQTCPGRLASGRSEDLSRSTPVGPFLTKGTPVAMNIHRSHVFSPRPFRQRPPVSQEVGDGYTF
jgi:hypothetical protein